MTIACLVVEDHPAVRAGVGAFLERADGLQLVGGVATPRQALGLYMPADPDVVILDSVFDVGNIDDELHGGDAVRAMLERWPQAIVLVYTAFACRTCMVAAFAAGARGYVLKTEELPVLVDVLRRAVAGEFPTAGLAGFLLDANRELGYELTAREREVLELLAEGATNREIGRVLGISPKTVANHLEAIRLKMRVGNRTEIVVKASRDGLAGIWNRSCACGVTASGPVRLTAPR